MPVFLFLEKPKKSKKIALKNLSNPLKYFLTCYRINLPEKGNNKQKCKKTYIDKSMFKGGI